MPATLGPVQSNFLTNYRSAVNNLLDARAELKQLRELAATQGYPEKFVVEAFAGTNADLESAALTAIFGAVDQLEMVLTDFSTVPPRPTATLAALNRFRQ